MTKETFPYLIKLGSTRNDYLLSQIIFHLLLALFMSVLASLITGLFKFGSSSLKIDNFIFFHLLEGTTLASTWLNELWFNFIICFFFLALGSMLGSIFYRFGLIGGFTAIVVGSLFLIVPTLRDSLIDTFFSFTGNSVQINFLAIFLFALISFIPNWLIIRRATTTASRMR